MAAGTLLPALEGGEDPFESMELADGTSSPTKVCGARQQAEFGFVLLEESPKPRVYRSTGVSGVSGDEVARGMSSFVVESSLCQGEGWGWGCLTGQLPPTSCPLLSRHDRIDAAPYDTPHPIFDLPRGSRGPLPNAFAGLHENSVYTTSGPQESDPAGGIESTARSLSRGTNRTRGLPPRDLHRFTAQPHAPTGGPMPGLDAYNQRGREIKGQRQAFDPAVPSSTDDGFRPPPSASPPRLLLIADDRFPGGRRRGSQAKEYPEQDQKHVVFCSLLLLLGSENPPLACCKGAPESSFLCLLDKPQSNTVCLGIDGKKVGNGAGANSRACRDPLGFPFPLAPRFEIGQSQVSTSAHPSKHNPLHLDMTRGPPNERLEALKRGHVAS